MVTVLVRDPNTVPDHDGPTSVHADDLVHLVRCQFGATDHAALNAVQDMLRWIENTEGYTPNVESLTAWEVMFVLGILADTVWPRG